MKLLILDESYRGRLRSLTAQLRGEVVAAKLDPLRGLGGPIGPARGVRSRDVGCTLDQVPRLVAEAEADAIFFVPSWTHPVDELLATLAALPGPSDRPPVVLFDTFDQSTSPYFAAIPLVDLYLKSQVYRDRSLYNAPMAGGFIVADWVHRQLGLDLGSWHFGSPIPEGFGSRLVCGWNMGVSRFYRHLGDLSRLAGPRWRDRPIEINRRFGVPDPTTATNWEWYQEYRRFCGLRVTELCGGFRQTGHTPLPRLRYLEEMRRSRIGFSPFGWGEVCFRDFETVALGAVLVKPDMGHLETYPDIYEDGVTYKAVRWDLSDLPEVCRWLLDHPDEAERIAETARARLASYIRGGRFAAQLERILERLGPRAEGAEVGPAPR